VRIFKYQIGLKWPGLCQRLLLLAILCPGSAAVAAPEQRPDVIPGSYVVVYKGGVQSGPVTDELARTLGLGISFKYRHALQGAAVTVPPGRLRALQQDPRVAYVEPDQIVTLAAQTLPTGIDRINAEQDSAANIDNIDDRVNVDIAILDTGLDLDHPDLNVYRYALCSTKGFRGSCKEGDAGADDGNGHGTHVGGTAAALDNNSGVVGVAPGARLWGVKVLGDDGSGSISIVIAGVDYVTAQATEIEVANMSLTSESFSQALHDAISNSVAAGVTYVLAAGNQLVDVSTRYPAGHPQAITVSALADFDGQSGGTGSGSVSFSTCTENVDDSFACFSNFGSGVDIMAPGVRIRSTWFGGGTAVISGTSMAAPHVTGAAALYMMENPGASPATVKAALLAAADPAPCANSANGHCADDPDGIQEPLLMLRCRDTDADGICDDIDNCPLISNPTQADSDGDGVGDSCDNCANTHNPDQADSDGDGIGDSCDSCPLIDNDSTADSDNDGLSDFEECILGTNPADSDTDGDTLLDGDELALYETDPLLPDSDGDGFDDGEEVLAGSDPLDSSSYPAIADGDLNGDQLVDARDVLIGLKIVQGQLTPTTDQLAHGDVAPLVAGVPQPDSVFNLGDLLLIQRKALGSLSF